MTEINFYEVDETVTKALAPLLLKVLEEKKKALIFCTNPAEMKKIDDSLWSYGRTKFIPHVTISDCEKNGLLSNFPLKRQVILISNREENSNEADYLIFFDEPSQAFISKFSRVFHFFEKGQLVAKVKPKNFYKKVDGKWVKGS